MPTTPTDNPTPVFTVHRLHVEGVGPVELTVDERGEGQPFLVLHGGAGIRSVSGFAAALAETGGGSARVITPTHPGFEGTPRPEALDSVSKLAACYVALLDEMDLTDVTAIGSSVGGWIAAEMALLGSARLARVVLVDAAGIEVPGHPIADVSSFTLDEIMDLSYHHPDPYRIDLSSLPPAALALAAGNRAALGAYSGPSSTDPTLRARLADLDLAALVIWGESDRIVDPDYGRAYAAAIPGAEFQLVGACGHLPSVEAPERLASATVDFASRTPAWTHEHTAETPVASSDIWATLRALYTGTELSDDGDHIEIHGPFVAGTRLSVIPQGADFVVDCTIIEVVEGEVFAYRTELNGVTITSRHTLAATPGGGTRITHHSVIAGPGAERSGPQIGPRITEDHPEAMDRLIAAAGGAAAGLGS